eukprot:2371561-Amphidinium_carterae.1
MCGSLAKSVDHKHHAKAAKTVLQGKLIRKASAFAYNDRSCGLGTAVCVLRANLTDLQLAR